MNEQDKRRVRFNIKIADYRHGQIVNYVDMPPGHRFWIDNKDILGASRICEFVNALGLTESEMEAKDRAAAAEAEALAKKEAKAKVESSNEIKSDEIAEFDVPLDIDFQSVETGSDPDGSEWVEFIEDEDLDKLKDELKSAISTKKKRGPKKGSKNKK